MGIGASAGGLKALEALFEHLSSSTGLTFVVVQHLSPDFKSVLNEILARHTTLPVVQAEHQMPLVGDTIFLIPPNRNIAIVDGQFVVTKMDRSAIQRPIDLFFQSLAHGYGRHSVGVILSGTGTDGVAGLRSIHEAGGLTIVQTPDSAQFDGMPANALATRCVNHVLPPAEIATALKQFGATGEVPPTTQPLTSEELSGIRLVFSLLSERHGINFSDYKETTVARRLERRIQARDCKSVREYAEVLRDDIVEIDALYHDLLIGVTKFFRDAEAFFALQTRINKVVRRLGPDEELRIWVAGCATGEEAYTIAMLAREAFDRQSEEARMKILATDVHQGALDKAASGKFSAESLEFVTPARQTRFFTPAESQQYRVTQDLRRHIVFARHNVVEDPPFTKIHIVSCRNMLIYLQARAQQSAIAAFHFALEPDGIMMLGSSETPGKLEGEFETLEPTWRIYRKLRSLPSLLSEHLPGSTLTNQPRGLQNGPRRMVNILNSDKPERLSFTGLLEAYDLLLEQYVSCGLLLDENRNVLHVFGDANRFLRSATGRFTGSIMRFLEGQARTTLGAALVRSVSQPDAKFVLRNVAIDVGDRVVDVDITVRSLVSELSKSFVWFVEFRDPLVATTVNEEEIRVTRPGDDYHAIESELAFTRESLSATIEELETSNEELQSTNEELIASNEELQSTNQELHSVNEELYSVNAENHRKITELQEVTEDIENLLSSTEIGTIFVDRALNIRRFTPAATRYFHLVDHDIGRALSNFNHNLNVPDLERRIIEVLDSGDTVSIKIETKKSETILLKIVPYVGGSTRKGAIINIIDLAAIMGSDDTPIVSPDSEPAE